MEPVGRDVLWLHRPLLVTALTTFGSYVMFVFILQFVIFTVTLVPLPCFFHTFCFSKLTYLLTGVVVWLCCVCDFYTKPVFHWNPHLPVSNTSCTEHQNSQFFSSLWRVWREDWQRLCLYFKYEATAGETAASLRPNSHLVSLQDSFQHFIHLILYHI